uniref:N-acetyltaurine hydrolase n=1 Tax=Chrysemys picta bellii TaxID=8478 RepID=A0A8C3IAY9_CHRPI|nr:phosphotriesterase-related protein [Chrysemys picta bellii]XP_008167887.1 phosphotriesterase-related protein [Chrysemys picta bellii]XP_023962058.1 phosphotriesterase-related protein [Chrysemys picta bellii]XP_023962060.1 phosphotriesterase-related protein [Chrysemys picta bellii]XP_023962063.1 phosphotriesterase-related protein [Chrysemys picta bellii]XP_042712643.1 phosphotriesterase-related protein [Chrysemys picta bellii]XP_042712644.1 phosphotriesterase-related protein [Chrysemys pict
MLSLCGKVQTVLGLVEPSQLGCTMTHEHLTMNYSCCYVPPSSGQEALSDGPIEMKNLFWIKQNPYSHKENLLLYQETDAVKEELLHYKAAGGGTIVENTTMGISRDVKTLKKLAEETGVHIIAGAGFYVHATHSSETQAMSVEQLTDIIVNEILSGADGTNIKCGVVGEIGCSWPLAESENKVLQATAHAQSQLGCPIIIHPGRNSDAPFQIIRILQESGADISKTVMSHLDRTIFDEKKLLEFAKLGCYLEYDLFGTEFLHYHFHPDIDMPSDNERIARIRMLIDEGYEDRIVIAHDVHTKNRLMKYGGHGYSHILKNIVPKLLIRGIPQTIIDKILIENPKQWLTFK